MRKETALIRNNIKVGALIQVTASDLYPSKNPEDYCIAVCRRSGLFDSVVLAVPDLEESQVFDELASYWCVELVKGSVFNVADRLLSAANRYEVDVIVRLLLRRFYLDTELVSEMINLLLSEQGDYVKLPNDFNYELAGDVFTRDALTRVVEMLQGDDMETAARQFSPWRVMDEDKVNFKTLEHPGSNDYPPAKVAAIKAKFSKLFSENQVRYGWKFPASAYAFVARFIRPNDVVLDISCGQGEGSRRLVESCAKVVGLDIDLEYVSNARQRFSGVPGLSYICDDAMQYCQPGTYDAIVSMHTLEHLPDPLAFLVLCRKNLKPKADFSLKCHCYCQGH